MLIEPIINLHLRNIKNKGLYFTWKWTDDIKNQLNVTIVKTIISIFYNENIFIKTVKLEDPTSTDFLYKDVNNRDLKLCLNISVRDSSNSSNSPDFITSYEQCIDYYMDQWSVSVSLGSSVAAFLVLLLIVSLIFLSKRSEKTRRIMHLKTSSKRKPRDSYIYVYHPSQFNELFPNDESLLNNIERKSSEGNTAEIECNSSKLDCESVSGIESLNSFSKEDSAEEKENKNYEIIKCNCGLIHLVGTEIECDNFLQQPVYYDDNDDECTKSVKLAPQDTMSITSESSL